MNDNTSDNKNKKKTGLTTLFLIISLCVSGGCIILFLAERWVFKTWSELSYDEIVYHMIASLEGTNEEMIRQVIFISVVPVAVFLVILGSIIHFAEDKRKYLKPVIIIMSVSLGLGGYAIYDLQKRTDFVRRAWSDLINGGEISTFVEDNYIDVSNIELVFPEHKRNLIYIFLESMEMTFADKESNGGFDYNCIPELTSIGKNNEDFSGSNLNLNGAISLPGATWTMGAMFAQTSGIPLKIPLSGNQMEGRESFFSKITTLGDILKAEGYEQVLLLGSDAKFGGRDIYFKEHGNYVIHDYIYAIKHNWIPENYHVWWGYEDEKLFEFAKRDIKKLAKHKTPFNYTMLTVDTHFSDGYVCRLCEDEFGDNQYANVFACSSCQVERFIEWIKKRDFYGDTTIILCGDHPTMDNDFCNEVSADYQRKTFTVIINGDNSCKKSDWKREYSTMDMFPTSLAALGVKIPGNRLGLGTDLYSDQETILEKYGIETCKAELEKPSELLNELSGIEITENEMRKVRETAYLEECGEGEKLSFRLSGIDELNIYSVKRAVLIAENKRTKRIEKYTMKKLTEKGSDTLYGCMVDTGVKRSELDDYVFRAHISAGTVNDYEVAVFPDN